MTFLESKRFSVNIHCLNHKCVGLLLQGLQCTMLKVHRPRVFEYVMGFTRDS